MTAKSECKRCYGSGRVPRDPDIGTDQDCFVCDGLGIILDEDSESDAYWCKRASDLVQIFTEHELIELSKTTHNAALDEAKQIFNQPHQEYFGQEIQDAIEALKELK